MFLAALAVAAASPGTDLDAKPRKLGIAIILTENPRRATDIMTSTVLEYFAAHPYRFGIREQGFRAADKRQHAT